MADTDLDDDFARALRAAWFRFLDGVEPHRRDLYRYCRALTGNLWDAEDLAQDTLLKAYAAMGRGDLHGEDSRVRSLRAYLLRIASHLWIDQARRARRAAALEADPSTVAPDAEARAGVRDAATRLLRDLAPKERASVVLKEVFDLSLEEIAELLSTSVGAAKSALHRARTRLAAPPTPARTGPSRALVDRFVAAFEERDAKALSALLLDTVVVEVPGVGGGRGPIRQWVESWAASPPDRLAVLERDDEWMLLCFEHEDGAEALIDVVRLEEVDGRVARIIDYYFAPDTLSALAAELGVEARHAGYHQPPEALVGMIATTGAPWISP